jgi:hypothetical protein
MLTACVSDVHAQFELLPNENGDWETTWNMFHRHQGERFRMYDQLNEQRAAIRARLARQVPATRQPPSPLLPLLVGTWSVHSRDVDGTNWLARVVFDSNQRLAAAFRGTSPRGEVSQQNFTASYSYFANGNIVVAVDHPGEVQINRIRWLNRNRFIVTPQVGSELTYDRLR